MTASGDQEGEGLLASWSVSTPGAAAGMAARGVRPAVARLPRTVHGDGDQHGFIARMIGIARDTGASGHAGVGSSRRPAVHVLDAAHLFRLAAERAPAGSALHAVADNGVPTRDIAGVIGRHLNLPAASVPAENFGFLGPILAIDQPASSALDPRVARAAADPARAHRGPRQGPLLRLSTARPGRAKGL